MKRLGWYAVSGLVGAVILGGVLLLAANLYVQSATVQQRIKLALTATLRMPVTLRKTTVTPWEGLRIDGLSAAPVPAPGVGAAPNFLKADSFRVHFALLPLFQRRCVITLLWLDKPELTWAQNSEGRWQFPPVQETGRRQKKTSHQETPAPPAVPESSPGASPAAEITASTPAAPSPAVAAATPEAATSPNTMRLPGGHQPGGFTVAFDRFRLRHGNLDFLSVKRHPVGAFEDVNLDGQFSDALHATGSLWFGKARLSSAGLTLTGLRSDFAFDPADGLTLSDGKAQFAGGAVAANFHLRTETPGSPFAADFQVEHVDLAQLLRQAGNHLPFIDGSLQGQVTASGLSDSTESRRATGHFELVNARLKEFPLFQALGDAMRIEDLSQMRFKTAQLDCKLVGAMLEIDPLLLVSNDMKITAQGRYLTSEDHLDIHARLIIDAAVSHQLPDFIGEQFKPCDEQEPPGSRFVDFDVTGSLNNPRSNLYNRLVGDPMKGLFNTLLSPGKTPKPPKDKPPKHHPDTPGPTASPPDTPPDGQ